MPPRQLWWSQLIWNLNLGIFAFNVEIRCLNYWGGKKETTKPKLEKFVRVWKCIVSYQKYTAPQANFLWQSHRTPSYTAPEENFSTIYFLLVNYILFNCPSPPPELVRKQDHTVAHDKNMWRKAVLRTIFVHIIKYHYGIVGFLWTMKCFQCKGNCCISKSWNFPRFSVSEKTQMPLEGEKKIYIYIYKVFYSHS